MARFVGFIVIGLICGAFADVIRSNPSFCKQYECPRYTVQDNFQQFELRQYDPSKWVSTSGPIDENRRGNEMFMKLFRYIGGNNEADQKMDMTVPVLRELSYEGDTPRPTKVTMHFMIPEEHSSSPPAPNDNSIFFTDMPQLNVYVRSFGGRATDRVNERQLRFLMNKIGDSSMFNRTQIFFATYDAPFKRRNRHNEVWIPKVDQY